MLLLLIPPNLLPALRVAQSFVISSMRSPIRDLEPRKIDYGRTGETSGTGVIVDINLCLNSGGKRMRDGSESFVGEFGAGFGI